MIFDVRHITEIHYEAMIRLARFNLRLKPATWPGQHLIDYRLAVDPTPSAILTEEGPYVVNTSRMTISEPIVQLTIESSFAIEVNPAPLPTFETTPTIAEVRASALAHRDLSQAGPASYLFASLIAQAEPEIASWANQFFRSDMPVFEAAGALMHGIYDGFGYDSDATKVETTPLEAFRVRRGVCQDFAHIMIIALRSQGIPAAYVSGYLRTIQPPGEERLVGADATHAWVNIWCGDAIGWVGFDPTNNLIVESDHIFTAMGRDYADVAPVDGVFHGGAGQEMKVSVDVAPRELIEAR